MNILNIPNYIDEKYTNCILVVVSEENYHTAFVFDGKVLAFEYMPMNYPSTTLAVHENINEYCEAIKDVAWINEETAQTVRTDEVKEVIQYNSEI